MRICDLELIGRKVAEASGFGKQTLYEISIHHTGWELLRRIRGDEWMVKKPNGDRDWGDKVREIVWEVDKPPFNYGHSGASAGASMSYAQDIAKRGHSKHLARFEERDPGRVFRFTFEEKEPEWEVKEVEDV